MIKGENSVSGGKQKENSKMVSSTILIIIENANKQQNIKCSLSVQNKASPCF